MKFWSCYFNFIKSSRLIALFPAIVSVAILYLLSWSLVYQDMSSNVPSTLIGKQIPGFSLPAIPDSGISGLNSDNFKHNTVTLLNFWSSWCPSCRVEHNLLMELSKNPSVQLVGINYKDSPINARRYLGKLGNPFSLIGWDYDGRIGSEFGVYGQPETFLVGTDGKIIYRHIGPLTRTLIETTLYDNIQAAHSSINPLN